MLELSKWDLDVETNDGEEYTSLVRAVRRNHQRFKLLFVSCSPSQGEKVRHDLMGDVPAKKYELLDIKESINNLYEVINNIPNLPELDVLFIRGLEYSIFEYEDQEFGDISKRSQSKVYGGSWAGVPPVLAKLNMQRELFRDRFPHICFVFLLPHFAINYFIRRAPDFYDWKSGIYRLETDAEDLKLQMIKFTISADYEKYEQLTGEEMLSKIRQIRSYLDEVTDVEQGFQLLSQLELCYTTYDQYLSELDAFNGAIEFKMDDDIAWQNRGTTLSKLGRYEEAIASYDRCLQIKPDDYIAWHNRGWVLVKLGRYHEAIASYDRSIQINPDDHSTWNNRGYALSKLGRDNAALASYDRCLQINPNDDIAWHDRGNTLLRLRRYEDAIASYDRSIQINPNDDSACYNRGRTLYKLGWYEEAIASYDRSLEINPNPDDDIIWHHRGNMLSKLGRYEDAIASYDRSLEIRTYEENWCDRGYALNDLVCNYHNKGLTNFKQDKYPEAIASWRQTFKIIQQERLPNSNNLIQEYLDAGILPKLKLINDSSYLIQEFLDEQLLPKFQQPAVRDILPQILTIYTTAQVLPELAVALTRNFKAIQSPIISDDTATEWLNMWQELGKPYPELAIALRMLEAGIKYKQNPTDDRVFLSLPQEIRSLLREALGLEEQS
jgi:tetratricopeptide (TPR) repeat protein